MQVEVEKLEGLSRRLKVVVPGEKVEEAYNERIKEIAKNVRLSGFRPGKIPLPVVETRFGAIVRREVVSELMQSSFQQAVTDHKLKVAGSPEVKPGEIAKGQDIKFEVSFETYPEVTLADFSQARVEKWTAEVTESDIERAMNNLRRQHAHWHVVDRVAAEGDRVNIDFDGFIDNKPFPGGSGKEFQLDLGSKQMIPGFEDGLIGVKAKDERSIDVTFPADYPAAHLAKQTAIFKVKVHNVQEAHMPEVDNAFAEQVGIKTGGVETLKKKLREDMQTELTHRLEAILKEQTLDRLIEMNPVTTPQSMVEEEIKNLQEIARQQIVSQPGWKGKDPASVQLPREPFIEQAKKRVILGLLVGEAVKELGIKSDKSKVRDKVNEMVRASGYHNPEEMAAWYYQNKRLLSEIETLVLEDQVVAKLLEKAQIIDKPVSYQEAFATTQIQSKV